MRNENTLGGSGVLPPAQFTSAVQWQLPHSVRCNGKVERGVDSLLLQQRKRLQKRLLLHRERPIGDYTNRDLIVAIAHQVLADDELNQLAVVFRFGKEFLAWMIP